MAPKSDDIIDDVDDAGDALAEMLAQAKALERMADEGEAAAEKTPVQRKPRRKEESDDDDDDDAPRKGRKGREHGWGSPPQKKKSAQVSARQRYVYRTFGKIKDLCDELRRYGVTPLVLYRNDDQEKGMNLLPRKSRNGLQDQLSKYRYSRMRPETQEHVHRAIVSLAKEFPGEEIA